MNPVLFLITSSLFLLLATVVPSDAGAGNVSLPNAVVAADGSGDFKSIQAAVMAAPYRSGGEQWTIRIKPGTYRERVYIQRERGCLRLIGDDPETTRLVHQTHANMPGPDGAPIGTFATATLALDGDGITTENLTVENAAGPVGQALALRVDGDKAVFRNCRFLGWQDTILLNRGRQYFENCRIVGHVDFIFGGATAWFEKCGIHCLKDGYITAASTPDGQRFGFVFNQCNITGEPETKTYLGRPWRPHAMTVFLKTEISGAVRAEGWHNWGKPENEKTVRYAEFQCSGPGAEPGKRVSWARQLTAEVGGTYSLSNVLGGSDGWNPAR